MHPCAACGAWGGAVLAAERRALWSLVSMMHHAVLEHQHSITCTSWLLQARAVEDEILRTSRHFAIKPAVRAPAVSSLNALYGKSTPTFYVYAFICV